MDLHFAMHPNRKKHCRKFHGYKYKAMHAVAQGNRRVLVAHLAAGELLEMSVQQEGSPQGSRASPSPACAQPEPPLTVLPNSFLCLGAAQLSPSYSCLSRVGTACHFLQQIWVYICYIYRYITCLYMYLLYTQI